MHFILSIDQGTTGTTALIANERLEIISFFNTPFLQIFPKPGWVEHREDDIWFSVKNSIKKCLEIGNIKPNKIDAIGITNQRETVGVFDFNGHLMHNFIVWQCRRSYEICKNLRSKGLNNIFHSKTGLVLDPYFSGTKLTWLFREYPKLKNFLIGTIDSWLLYRFSGGKIHATDATNASRTLMMNLKDCSWNDELIKILEIPSKCLPEIRTSSEMYAKTNGLDFLPDNIPITSLIGDQQAALFGQACFNKGDVKATYGTGCFILLNTGEEPVFSQCGILTSLALKTNEKTTYCLEASSFAAGAAIQWLKDGLNLIKKTSEIEDLAKKVNDSAELVFVPALSGLGSPYWKPDIRGAFVGITRDTNKFHFARAVLEGIALLNQDMLIAMSKDIKGIACLKVDGGAAVNDLLIQLQADVSGINCIRPSFLEMTSIGAVALAGLAVGIFKNKDLNKNLSKSFKIFNPIISKEERDKLQQKWHNALYGFGIPH